MKALYEEKELKELIKSIIRENIDEMAGKPKAEMTGVIDEDSLPIVYDTMAEQIIDNIIKEPRFIKTIAKAKNNIQTRKNTLERKNFQQQTDDEFYLGDEEENDNALGLDSNELNETANLDAVPMWIARAKQNALDNDNVTAKGVANTAFNKATLTGCNIFSEAKLTIDCDDERYSKNSVDGFVYLIGNPKSTNRKDFSRNDGKDSTFSMATDFDYDDKELGTIKVTEIKHKCLTTSYISGYFPVIIDEFKGERLQKVPIINFNLQELENTINEKLKGYYLNDNGKLIKEN